MAKLVPSTTEFWVGSAPPFCDLCHQAIKGRFVDGKTQMGPWANMCLACHRTQGCGLGTGKGQAYLYGSVTDRWHKLVPPKVGTPAKSVQPSERTLEKWSRDGVAKSTDGCRVEPDGVCSHGAKSWLLELGLV
jgi:hypothetical protein